ncbi:MAG: NADH-quinone oxidoreductase subunit A [Anaerolineae bacterium]
MSNSLDWIAVLPAALAGFMLLLAGLYWLSGRWSAKSSESPGKHLPYACGQDIVPASIKFSYHFFFHLALMFVVVHVASLVLATVSNESGMRLLATAYIIGIIICVDILTWEKV